MKKLSTVLLGLGLLVSSALYAAESNKSTAQQATHLGDHMHEGKMMNHKHPDFYPDHSKVPAEGEVKRDPNYWNNQTNMNAIYAIQVKNGVIK